MTEYADHLRWSRKRCLCTTQKGKPGVLDKHLPQDLRAGEQLLGSASQSPLAFSSLVDAESGECHQRDHVPVEEMHRIALDGA